MKIATDNRHSSRICNLQWGRSVSTS